jgi:drug/metabolite transporter (DMT)-like permease
MGSLTSAWVIGIGIGSWTDIVRGGMPPQPRRLLFITALFAGLALISESEQVRPIGSLVGWGLDLAALLNYYSNPAGKASPGGISNWASQWGSTPKTPDDTVFPPGEPGTGASTTPPASAPVGGAGPAKAA